MLCLSVRRMWKVSCTISWLTLLAAARSWDDAVDIVLARIPEITIPPMIAASTPKPESRLAISIRMFS